MSDKFVQELFTRLNTLAAKLGVTAEHLWAVLLKQARIEVISGLCLAGISIAVLIVGLLGLRWSCRNWDDYKREDTAVGIGIASGIVIIGGLIATCVNLYNTITPWLNPEFWALRQLF